MHRSFFSHFVQRASQAVDSFVYTFGYFFHDRWETDFGYFHFNPNVTAGTIWGIPSTGFVASIRRGIVFSWMGRCWRSWRRRFGNRLPAAATG